MRRLVSKWSSYIQNDLSTDIAISLLKRATRLVKKAAIAFRDPKFPTSQLLSIPEYSGGASGAASESYAMYSRDLGGPRMIGMSPESVRVRVEGATNAAKVAMLSDLQAQSEKFMESQARIFETTLRQKGESGKMFFDMQRNVMDFQDRNQGRQRIADAYGAFDDPSAAQMSMLSQIVEANAPSIGNRSV